MGLVVPRGVRPTSALVRQAVFNILGPAVAEASVLDLFAGSGALGIEALSRGAAEASFVDASRLACAAVRQNLAACGLSGKVVHADALRAVERLAGRDETFDLILADPPYASSLAGRLLSAPDLPRLLAPGGRVAVESADELPPPDWAEVLRQRRWGDTVVMVLGRREEV